MANLKTNFLEKCGKTFLKSDEKLEIYLSVFGAISIEGPKWCGKSSTGSKYAKKITYLSDKKVREYAKNDFDLILSNEYPQLIDEWQLVPSIWDEVRHRCDIERIKGKYILTGSTTLRYYDSEDEVFHSGAGRFAILKMYPMSLYESLDSTGDVSIMDMYNGVQINKKIKAKDLLSVAELIVRGGWPENIIISKDKQNLIPKQYIDIILSTDIHQGKKRRNSDKMNMILKSLARNESTIAGFGTIVKDISENENEILVKDRKTVADYIATLKDLYLLSDIPAFRINYRSSDRIGKSSKRHLVDPSLACALLNLTPQKLMDDFKVFGYMFESLVVRDLRIYIEHLGGNIYHFKDNISGDEVDAILEFESGLYAAIEIKLSHTAIDEAKKSLLKFYENAKKKPAFMCIIVASIDVAYQAKETCIYILPITALKP